MTLSAAATTAIWEASVIILMAFVAIMSFIGAYKEKKENEGKK